MSPISSSNTYSQTRGKKTTQQQQQQQKKPPKRNKNSVLLQLQLWDDNNNTSQNKPPLLFHSPSGICVSGLHSFLLLQHRKGKKPKSTSLDLNQTSNGVAKNQQCEIPHGHYPRRTVPPPAKKREKKAHLQPTLFFACTDLISAAAVGRLERKTIIRIFIIMIIITII